LVRKGQARMIGCLDGFLSRLCATGSSQETWDETMCFQKSLGFDLLMYGYAALDSGGSPGEVATLSNFPTAYQKRYREQQYYRDDPVVHHCIGNLAPLRVGRDSLHLWPNQGRGLTEAQHRIIHEAADCGMAVGVVIPLRSPGRYPVAGMSLSNAMGSREFGRFLAEWGQVAQLAAIHSHTRLQMQLQAAGRADSGVVLSSQERECLLWVARGMSSKETAKRIGLSPKTVDFHIAKVMAKMGGATRSHAVARAITLGLLDP